MVEASRYLSQAPNLCFSWWGSACIYVTGLFTISISLSECICNQQELLQQRPNEVQGCNLRRSQSLTFEHDLGNMLDASGMNLEPSGVKRNSVISDRFLYET